jgi:16S rRNA A1518/A1519 N6-dimethyltransferase RsmA/KsgA/DIM1 with predicted DNA glycosylase/AP lyase activity
MLTLGFLRGGLQHYVVEHFIADAIASRRFLQPGDTVVARAPGLGAITSIIRP